MTTLYDSAVYDRTLPVGSYWETTVAADLALYPSLTQDQTCDVAIIGGGITGLSTALHLARDHHIQACVLEAGAPAWGASGRNGGFCCIGSTRLSNHALLTTFGRDETYRYFQEQRNGTRLVREIADAEGFEIDPQGDGEILSAHTPSRWAELEKEHAFLTDIAEYPCQLWSKKDMAESAFSSPEAHGALHIRVGFGLNPLKYSLGLAKAAHNRGATIYAHSPVITWEKQGNWHLLRTPTGTLRAKTVVIATNGYTHDRLHPSLCDRLLPVLSNIITTRPLTQAELDAQGWHTETPAFDTRNLLFYYRLLKDRRFLFGSRGGTVGDAAERDRHRRWMIRRFQHMFPQWRDVDITHFWNGLACFSTTLTPHVGQLSDDPSVFYGMAYHGNGVATGTWSGQRVARLVAAQETMDQLCTVVRQPFKAFPVPSLRIWYLRAAYGGYRLQDALP
jgi:glycine/D-amino acid oxidase-like deaminating enzyme